MCAQNLLISPISLDGENQHFTSTTHNPDAYFGGAYKETSKYGMKRLKKKFHRFVILGDV